MQFSRLELSTNPKLHLKIRPNSPASSLPSTEAHNILCSASLHSAIELIFSRRPAAGRLYGAVTSYRAERRWTQK